MNSSDPPRRARVLFVDDEPRITRALKALFRDMDAFEVNDPRLAARSARLNDVDVVVCDQRMPQMAGADCLREIRLEHPRALRLLLTGYADLKAVIGSVNDGEVFRFINKPWDNAELRRVVEEAARVARETPALPVEPISEQEQEQARSEVGLLVVEDDAEVQQRLREILQTHYRVQFAATTDRALQILEQQEIGVVISETHSAQGDLTVFLKALKQYHPHIAVVVLTDRADAQVVAELINDGQVYRMLLKPVRMGSCRLAVDSALSQYAKLKQQPEALQRFQIAAPTAETPAASGAEGNSLLARIRGLHSRLAQNKPN